MTIVRRLERLYTEGREVRMETDGCPIRVWFLPDHVVRVRAGFEGTFREESYSVLTTAWESVTDECLAGERRRVEALVPGISEAGEEIRISAGGMTVLVEKDPFVLRVLGEDGAELSRSIPELGFMEDANGRRIHTFALGAEEHIFGLGETSGHLEKNGERFLLDGGDTCGYDASRSDPLYKQIPFFIRLSGEGRACGCFYDFAGACAFDFGKRRRCYWERYASYTADAGDIDLYLIDGPSVAEVLGRYLRLTGMPVLLPREALGYLGSSMYYPELDADADRAIEEFADTAAEEGMGMSGFMLSSGYCNVETAEGLKRCSFTFNRERFPDPEGFFLRMRQKGAPVCANVKPGILSVHPLREALEEEGVFVRDASGENCAEGPFWGGRAAFFDYTDERGRAAWRRLLRENLLAYGCGAVWNDNCEFDSLIDAGSRVSLEGAGSRLAKTKSLMANLMCLSSNAAMREAYPDRRPFSVCRAGYAGIQRYAQIWTGDNATSWESLRMNLPMMLGLSLSGCVNVGSDVGGFYGPAPSEELLLRWVQHGIFMPRFSVHSSNSDNTVTEPWMYEGAREQVREAFAVRRALMPYLYSRMVLAHREGTPIMAPALYYCQGDPKAWQLDDTFFFGDALYVANVLEEGAEERTVYFPRRACAGDAPAGYYDLRTGVFIPEGETRTFPVDLSSIPMFLCAGSILAWEDGEGLTYRVGAGNGSFRLFAGEDAPDDRGEEKLFLAASFAGQTQELSVCKAAGAGEERVRIVLFCGEHCPEAILKESGEPLPRFLRRERLKESGEGWFYDHSLRAVRLAVSVAEGGSERLSVRYSKKDLFGMW